MTDRTDIFMGLMDAEDYIKGYEIFKKYPHVVTRVPSLKLSSYLQNLKNKFKNGQMLDLKQEIISWTDFRDYNKHTTKNN